jgi:DNA-binding transcriptional ArsR family regulator
VGPAPLPLLRKRSLKWSVTSENMLRTERLQIINALREYELNVTQVVEHLRIPKANVSQHLAVLRQKRVVVTRREGLNVYYRIANPKIIQACDLMRQVLLDQLEEGKRLAKRLNPR